MAVAEEGQAPQVSEAIRRIVPALLDFIASADQANAARHSASKRTSPSSCQLPALLEPKYVSSQIGLALGEHAHGLEGAVDLIQRVLDHSVNTWDQGFMHKLYSGTNAVGVAAELALAVLNTNLHVYSVSPALSTIETETTRALADLFGLSGQYAGGISQPGGSASNLTSLLVARHRAFPLAKAQGWQGQLPVMFTSEDCHYSLKKAAEICGMGSQAVWSIKCDKDGKMSMKDLRSAVQTAKQRGYQPFYVNATAGTTVRGAFDPINEIADICEEHGLWLHVDGSLGGSLIFSDSHNHKLRGSHRADSITINPHKMLAAPVTCSFLLGADMRTFKSANTVDAEYLFHGPAKQPPKSSSWKENTGQDDTNQCYDLADLTPQCGRKGDALKLALGWVYYGREGYGRYVDDALQASWYLAQLVARHPELELVGSQEPECVQVCFYYTGLAGKTEPQTNKHNTWMSAAISNALPERGFMVDFAPGPKGKMLRVAVNGSVEMGTLERLVDAVVVGGREAMAERA